MDHPRMRGEDCGGLDMGVEAAGSPPHARGRPGFRTRGSSGCRITPACAGKTVVLATVRLCCRDHPACAGKTSHSAGTSTQATDHPRMRGEDEAFPVDGAE